MTDLSLLSASLFFLDLVFDGGDFLHQAGRLQGAETSETTQPMVE
jgi:hypothetical protein